MKKTIEEKGLQVHVSKGENQTIMGLIGDTTKVDPESIEVDPAVEKVMHVSEPYKLANRASIQKTQLSMSVALKLVEDI
mgnify:CR=1 FL=1